MAAIEIGRAVTADPYATVIVFRDSYTGGVRVRAEDASKPPRWVGSIEVDSARISSNNPEVRSKICGALREALDSASGLPPKAISLLHSRANWSRVQDMLEESALVAG